MNSKLLVVGGLLSGLVAFNSCNDTQTPDNTVATTPDSKEISLSPFDNPSPAFDNASLSIADIKAELQGTDSAKITIDYKVDNYELKSQTPDAATKGCNNSKDGQHIHFILNNGPYTALYEPTHTFTIPLDQPQYVMSFLSRSYHESLKHKPAAQLLHFKVGKSGKIENLEIPQTPMIFYSRPKGDYVGKENTDNLLLDFYLWNTNLTNQNLKVKVQINQQEFNLDSWQPMFIKYAPMGELKVTLSLVDTAGNVLSGDNTSVSRSSKLALQEPIK